MSMQKFITVILYIWQLPQHLLALILIALWKPHSKSVYEGRSVYRISFPGIGVSLGNYIFLDDAYGNITVKHEYGHTRQSLMLGLLYLPVIGFASAVCNNLWDRIFHRHWSAGDRRRWYYCRFPEAWADRLGGVIRFE